MNAIRTKCTATEPRRLLAFAALAVLVAAPQSRGGGDGTYRGRLGENSPKVKREGGKTFVWAGNADGSRDPKSESAQWFDFTGAPLDPAKLQFGIGKDRIRSIDDPVYVSPDDPRLLEIRPSPYRPEERPKSNDDIPVIGYVVSGEALAFPTALLDGHELVNDTVGGKPVTVGW